VCDSTPGQCDVMLMERYDQPYGHAMSADLSALSFPDPVSDHQAEIRKAAGVSRSRATDSGVSTKRLEVTLVALRQASKRTMMLRLKFADGEDFKYRPGQFIGLGAPDGRQRFFSIANADPIHNELELHVNRVPEGVFTSHLFDKARIGDRFWMEGPFGDFTVQLRASSRTILVAGGTGFAPIKACLEQMAADRPTGMVTSPTIYLYWGVRSLEDLYDIASLETLSERLPGLCFVPVVDHGDPDCGARTGFVHRAVIEDFDDLSDYDIYACGARAMIEALSRDCAAERGFDPSRLVADIFTTGPARESVKPAATSAPVELFLDQATAMEGVQGEALLFALKRAGVDLPAVCGGKGACGTCRIHVAPEWRWRIAGPSKREARLLQFIGAGEGDRLSCQIPLTADLSGLELQNCAENKGDK
jgi:CDP-4-dehydro-6-deoxyglucose reductase